MTAPIRILELRSVRGTGGGPEKTILQGAAQTDPARFAVTVCYLRDVRDRVFAIDRQARELGLDYVDIPERHSFDPGVWPALCRLIREQKIDIVHSHDYKTDLLALLLSWRLSVIPLATVHHWVGTSRREQVYYWFDKRVLRAFPRLVAVSGATRDLLMKAGVEPARIQVILNGINPERFRRDPTRIAAARAAFGILAGEITIGAVCRLDREKRLDLLLEAVAQLRQKWAGLRLLVAGDGGQRESLETLAVRLGLGPACRFVGHCSNVIAFQHALDVFVQSSQAEGTSNAVLEAMALETPIVATAVGGTDELLTDGVHGLLIRPRDLSSLRSGIERVLADPAAARERARAARQRVEKEFSFQQRMRKVEAIYEDLVAQRASFRRARP